MQLPSHLRLSRHGVWSYRLVLPEIIANALGQKKIRKSLGTRCPITAKYLAYHLSGKILPIVRKAKHRMTLDPNSIDPKSVRELIVRGLEIDRSSGSLKAEYIETSSAPEIAKREKYLSRDFNENLLDYKLYRVGFAYKAGRWNDWLKKNLVP